MREIELESKRYAALMPEGLGPRLSAGDAIEVAEVLSLFDDVDVEG